MKFYLNTSVKERGFDDTIDLVTMELKNEGFGVLTEIDISKTLKEKIGADFKRYKILGACNPNFAHQALTKEDKIGVLLPCNVIVEENEDGSIEVSAVDPLISMSAVENEGLKELAGEVKSKLEKVISRLS